MDKTNYSVARVETYTRASIEKAERHNERKNKSYSNMNVDLTQTPNNVHYKKCESTYNFCICSSNRFVIGGGEESRTPVHNTFHINFSECSLLFIFIYITQANMLNINIASKYPLSPKLR